MSDERELLRRTAEIAGDFLETLDERSIAPAAGIDELRAALGGPLPDESGDPLAVVEALAAAAEPGVVGIPSGRYFGFVIGGALPAALAADWLTSVWDQNAGLVVGGPSAAVCEEIAGEWLKELLGIPASASFAFATGCQMAHATCLAAARHGVLSRAGWNVEHNGLTGAPRIRVLAGTKRHATIDRSLRLLGLGTASIVEIPDELEAITALADAAGAWLHVDGAFGLWAAASSELRHLTRGAERADSWATDAHKWLNVPYDCGIAFVADPEPRVPRQRGGRARPDGLDAGVLTTCPRNPGVRSTAFAGAQRSRGSRGGIV